jgi:hypothetical protein
MNVELACSVQVRVEEVPVRSYGTYIYVHAGGGGAANVRRGREPGGIACNGRRRARVTIEARLPDLFGLERIVFLT